MAPEDRPGLGKECAIGVGAEGDDVVGVAELYPAVWEGEEGEVGAELMGVGFHGGVF
jgi:hypothetical protein